MSINVLKKGFNYSQDGDGNRLVYHLQGCNLKCKWCSNPESMDLKNIGTEIKSYEVKDLLLECLSSKRLMFDNGGVTFSGGEPTCQFEELKKILILLKENGINTAIETNATHPNLNALFPYIDLLIMDFKHYDSSLHKKYTGVDNEIIKQNLTFALIAHNNVLIRTVLINNINSREDDAREFLKFFSNKNCSQAHFEFLPYHEYGKVKWDKIGSPYTITNGHVSTTTVNYFENLYRNNGLKVIRT